MCSHGPSQTGHKALPSQAAALVHIYLDGSVLLTHGGCELGQGLHTKMMQVRQGRPALRGRNTAPAVQHAFLVIRRNPLAKCAGGLQGLSWIQEDRNAGEG